MASKPSRFADYYLSAYVLGVRADIPTIRKHHLIETRLGDLRYSEGTVVTKFELVPVHWKMKTDGLHFHVEIPEGITATLRLRKKAEKAVLHLNGKEAPASSDAYHLWIELRGGVYDGVLQLD